MDLPPELVRMPCWLIGTVIVAALVVVFFGIKRRRS